jgi:energy-coupling factor transporter ATP-binding protein EcfA2
LLALGSLQGVALVSENEELTFGATGLTLIYGQNAVGKSSYVRALKVLCRTVDRDCMVLGNVYEQGVAGPAPSARIKVDVSGAVVERRTRLDRSAEVRLPDVSVFDTASAELYVNAQNVVEYIPAELRVLARLAVLQDRMRRDLAREQQELRNLEPSRDAYPLTTKVGMVLAELQGTSADPDLVALATLNTEDQARITELRGIITAMAGSTSRADELAARREAGEAQALTRSLTTLARRGSMAAAAGLRKAAADDEEAKAALRLSAGELTGPVPGVGGEPWRLMWEAATSFVEGAGGVFPPSVGEHCPLCLQQVSIDTADRLARFRTHVSSTVQARALGTASQLTAALAECGPAHADQCRVPVLAVLREREPDSARRIDQLISEIAEHLARMHASPKDASGTEFDVEAAATELVIWADRRLSHADALLAAEDPEKRRTAIAELAELEARQRLASDIDVFRNWRTNLGTIAALGKAHSALATNRITAAQRDLTESAIGKALGTALMDELTSLSCTHLPVEMSTRTQVAETKVGLRLLAPRSAGLSDIVSDGERRALALCFFLAELSVASGTSGIIVDDPVSSLDDERRDYIARRLVAEARERQVIVFTHDLPFVFDVRSQAKKAGVPLHFQHIWRLGEDAGRVDSHPPFKTMNLRERIRKLEAELLEAKADPPPSHYEQAWRRTSGFYQRVRTSWERAVEERMFAGVVERFERDVKTQQLRNIKVAGELVSQVEQGMTRASTFLHEGAFAAQITLPSLAEMSQDLDALRAFERETRPSGN